MRKNEQRSATEATQNSQTFEFSAEDLKAVKFMLFIFLFVSVGVLIYGMVAVLLIMLVESRYKTDIFFKVIAGWFFNYLLGPHSLLFASSKETFRKLFRERYFKKP